MTWLEITFRVLISYFVLLIMTRLMGKEQLSHLTFFNYVTGITIGSMAASLATDENLQFQHGIYSLILWASLTILMEFVTLKSDKISNIIGGRPIILIKHGKIVESALVKSRINMDELNMLLRKYGVFDTYEVDYAILENNGELNVLKKIEYQNYIKKDSNKSYQPVKNLPVPVIKKGKINYKSLNELGLDEKWLEYEVKKRGHNSIGDVFYAEVSSDGQLFIMPVEKYQIKNKL